MVPENHLVRYATPLSESYNAILGWTGMPQFKRMYSSLNNGRVATVKLEDYCREPSKCFYNHIISWSGRLYCQKFACLRPSSPIALMHE
jgi:hypothetical protein